MGTRAAATDYATLRVAPNLHAVLGSGYVPIPLPVLASGLNPTSKLVYAALCHFVQVSEWKGNDCAFPSHPQLAATAGVALASVARSLKELQKHRLLICKRRGLGLHNEYWLVDQEDWDLPPAPEQETPLKKSDQEPSKRVISNPQNEGSGSAKMADLSPQNECSHKDKEEDSNQESITKITQQMIVPRARAREGGAAADAADAAPPEHKESELRRRGTDHPAEGCGAQTSFDEAGNVHTPPPSPAGGKQASGRGRARKYAPAVLAEMRLTGDAADWATCEYLERVRGMTELNMSTYRWWRAALGELVKRCGREGFSVFLGWLYSDEWCRENAAIVQPDKVVREFDEWWSKPEPRPTVRSRPHAAPAKRDDGRVSNAIRDVQYLDVCVDCGAALGEPHYDFCNLLTKGILRPGALVADEHMKNDWVINRLRERRSAS